MLDLKVARVTGRQVPTPFTSGGAQVLGLIIKDLPTDSAEEPNFLCHPILRCHQRYNFSFCLPNSSGKLHSARKKTPFFNQRRAGAAIVNADGFLPDLIF